VGIEKYLYFRSPVGTMANKENFARCSYRAHAKRGFRTIISEMEVMNWVSRHDDHCEICGKKIDWSQKAAQREGPEAPTIDVFGEGRTERKLDLQYMRLVHYKCNIAQGDAGTVPQTCIRVRR
jgi:hypothetical protein